MITGNILLYSQEIHSALQLRNNHLWRGIEVASGLVYTGDIHLDYKNFYAGFWAGGTANGDYKEFNNYIGYKTNTLYWSYGISTIFLLMPPIITKNF